MLSLYKFLQKNPLEMLTLNCMAFSNKQNWNIGDLLTQILTLRGPLPFLQHFWLVNYMTFIILVTNQNQFWKYLDSLLKNYITIKTLSLIGLNIIGNLLVLAIRPVVLRG